MNFKLNIDQIEYIFFHINFYFELDSEIKERFVFGEKNGKKVSGIYFPLSENALNETKIKYINNIPILFPLSDASEFYSLKGKNLYFRDDLLKSIFFLLSGYQETLAYKGDQHGRFCYDDSIQKRLNIAEIPLVNIYFKIITSAVEEFCKIHGISFKRRNLWGDKKFAFMLTHDVDRVDKYTIHKLKNTIKQTVVNNKNRLKNFKQMFIDIFYLAVGNNPYWNFDWMKKVENEYDFNSTWFFLPKGEKHRDAYYSFDEKRIQDLIDFLQKEGDEIGLHGVYGAKLDKNLLKKNYNELATTLKTAPVGIRQHWLNFKYPQTLQNMEKIGFRYDSSWAFADHVGWRNSYCLPFKPWDFSNNKMLDIWEFPLTVMDASLFDYQNLSMDEAMLRLNMLIKNTKKNNGLFVLLWHNSYFEEEMFSGIHKFYINLLNKFNEDECMSILPKNLVIRIENEFF